jgi:hypothetical protein
MAYPSIFIFLSLNVDALPCSVSAYSNKMTVFGI